MHPLRMALDAINNGRSITEVLTGADIAALGSPELIEAMYEAQAGTYTAEQDDEALSPYTAEVASVFAEHIGRHDAVLDVGTGEGNRLLASLQHADHRGHVCAVDISWSRLSWAQSNATAVGRRVDYAVGAMLNLPLPDGSVDWVTSVHAIEPNHGYEADLLVEMARVARIGLLLIEPDWDLACDEQRERMATLGFIGSLRTACERAGLRLSYTRPLRHNVNPLNAASVFVVEAPHKERAPLAWRDPVGHEPLLPFGGGLRTPSGLFYPVLSGIPFLRTIDGKMTANPAPGVS